MDVADINFPSTARYLISDFTAYLESYLSPDQIGEVYEAYLFAAEAHQFQKRLTGEPYIYHPIAVARILAGLHMDHKCLMAAILHDVIEDTETAKATLAERFGDDVAELVDGVSKLTRIDFQSRAEAQAASLRKMLLAMTRDVRVILIKLADRLHNMRTLGVMRPDKARRIARETLDIYAPIANRLGINSIRIELEDLAFQAHWPWRYRIISAELAKRRGSQRAMVGDIEKAIQQRLVHDGLDGRVIGREKHLYSIYRKMRRKRSSLSEVADIHAFRIIVDDVDTCYRVLGAMHSLYKPLPGRFKDFIAIPKANGYQSLHTVLFGPHGLPIEVQIRTEEMHRLAESGIAAHWMYKTPDMYDSPQSPGADWLQEVLDLQKQAGDSIEFLENVKIDLYPDEVYVFTPRGKIVVLPKRATVLDFAYAIHSDIGNHCVMARVDRKIVPLRSRLYNGQTVEIVTSPDARPNPAWLEFVTTARARANIRGYLKKLRGREAIDLGRRLLGRALSAYGLALETVDEARMRAVLDEYRLEVPEQLYEDVGLGNRPALLVASRLVDERPMLASPSDQDADDQGQRLAIQGTEGMVVGYARCCRPVPGDAITAVFHRGKGLVVHQQVCPNIGDYGKRGDEWLDVQWEREIEREFSAALRVEVGNQRGVLAVVAAEIAEMGSNIESVSNDSREGGAASIDFVLTVRNLDHLRRIMRRLESLPNVMRVKRPIG